MGFRYSASSWASWPSCAHPRTVSFRATEGEGIDHGYLVDNPLWFDDDVEAETTTAALTLVLEGDDEEEAVESVVRGIQRSAASSGRLFIEPSGHSSSILLKEDEEETDEDHKGSSRVTQHEGAMEGAAEIAQTPFKGGGVAVKVKSADPYADFRASMQEMIVAHGWMGWDWLQDMLEWYLQANGAGGKPCGHSEAIVQAFVDMIMEQVFSIPSARNSNFSYSSRSSVYPDSPATSSSSSSFFM